MNWISIEEKQPYPNDHVLALDYKNEIWLAQFKVEKITTTYYISGNEKNIKSVVSFRTLKLKNKIIKNVTHWYPIPNVLPKRKLSLNEAMLSLQPLHKESNGK